MEQLLNPRRIEDYRLFLRVKSLPRYQVRDRLVMFPDEYARDVGLGYINGVHRKYEPPSWMFDYQRAITSLAITKKRFAVFADCGLGKTPILLEFARYAATRIPVLLPGCVVRFCGRVSRR